MSESTVKLGLMPPLSGLVGIYGAEIARAGQIACQEVNENGGVLGKPLELKIEDDGSLPETAVVAANKLIKQHRCSAIIGNLLSNSRIAVAYRVAELHKIPYLNFSFYEGSILSRYFFHFAALPNQQIDQMIPYMRQEYGPRMFFAGNNYEWPRGSIHAAKHALIKSGGTIAGEEYYPIGVGCNDIETLLDHLEDSSPDVFVPYFAGADQVNLLTRFTERGLKKSMAVVMGHYDEMMASQLPPEVREGFYSSNTYFMSVATAENHNYLNRLARLPEVTGIWPDGNGILTNFGEGAYICVKAFAQAANRAGSLDSEALVNTLNTIAVSAPQGMVQMKPEHHHAQVNTYLSRCTADGVFSIVKKLGTINPVLPERYNHQRISHQATIEDDIRLQARMLEQMSEGIFLINTSNSSIIYANAGAERIFGYDKGELIGESLLLLSDPAEQHSRNNAAEIIRLLNQKGEWRGESRSIKKNGAKIWCSVSFSTFTHPLNGEVWMGVYRDISQLKSLQQEVEGHRQHLEQQVTERTTQLAESEQQLRRAQQIAKIGHWTVNLISGELTWSDEIYRIFGRDRATFQPSYNNFYACIHPDDRVLVKNSEQTSFETGHHKIDHRVVLPDGSIRWVHEEAELERDSNGQPLRLTGTVQDITDQKHVELELMATRDEAERANKAKSEFLSRMSHELRTPMNAILGFAQVLELENIEPHQKEFVAEINHAGQHLLELINELLDYSIIEAGRLVTALQTITLESVMTRALQLVQTQAIARSVVISNLCTGSYSLLADPTRVRQILVNLLANAVKYNRQGGKITLSCEPVSSDRLRINITDTGPGIAPEKLKLLFSPFERLGAEFGAIEGTGIGLALSKQLAELMNGSIGVQSHPGQGSTFWFELPLSQKYSGTSTLLLDGENSPDIDVNAHSFKVLYVEDNAANLRLVEAIFHRQPMMTLLSANNGKHGLELAQRYQPDVILLDIHLPGMDGYKILKALKQDTNTHDIPVIALSADALPVDIERGLKAGFAEYLTKPVKVDVLLQTMQKQLNNLQEIAKQKQSF